MTREAGKDSGAAVYAPRPARPEKVVSAGGAFGSGVDLSCFGVFLGDERSSETGRIFST